MTTSLAQRLGWNRPLSSGSAKAWWEEPWFALFLIFLAIAPLIWPTNPPLVDYPGHLGRYRVASGLETSPFLGQYYNFHWQLVGNLGVDLLVIPLSWIFGLELAGKLLVMAIPALTVSGLILIAREIHGRLPPTMIFIVPLAYSYPFQFGFVNSCLSVALALNAFALWLRLEKMGRRRLRAGIFIPLSCAIWITHTVGWGVLGILCGAAEFLSPERRATGFFKRAGGALIGCLPVMPPVLLMLLWRGGDAGGQTKDMFFWRMKWRYAYSVLREQDKQWDIVGFAVLAAAIILSWLRGPKGIEARMALAVLAMIAAYILMPRIAFGSAYADMRLFPVVMMFMFLAIKPMQSARLGQIFAAIALVCVLGRMTVTTIVYARYDAAHTRQLKALEAVPRGARILVLVGKQCGMGWYSTRLEHIGSMAIVRKDAFVNDQWMMPGAQLLTVHYTPAGRYMRDSSQMVPTRINCRLEPEFPITQTLRQFPRAAFDYIWMMNLPRKYWPVDPEFEPVHRSANGILYRIVKPTK